MADKIDELFAKLEALLDGGDDVDEAELNSILDALESEAAGESEKEAALEEVYDLLFGEKHPGHGDQSVHGHPGGGRSAALRSGRAFSGPGNTAAANARAAAAGKRARANQSANSKKRNASQVRSNLQEQSSSIRKQALSNLGQGPKKLSKREQQDAANNERFNQLQRRVSRKPNAKKPGSSIVWKVKLPKSLYPKKTKEFDDNSVFTLTKDLTTDRLRWFSLVSNNFYDRDNEVFTEQSHRDYVDYVEATKDFPELWVWHTPGTRFGSCDFVDYADNFLIASGLIDEGAEVGAQSLVNSKERIGVSHGYKYRMSDKKEDGSYAHYRTFEVSVLPAHRASNYVTMWHMQSNKEDLMSLREDKKAFLVEHFGAEKAERIEAQLEELSKEIVGSGVRFKEIFDSPEPEEEAVLDDDGDDDDDAGSDDSTSESAESADAGESEADAVLAGVKALTAEFTSVKEILTKVTATLDGLDTRVSELEKSDDEKVSAKLAPRKAAVSGMRPSESSKNVVDADKEKVLEEAKDAPENPVAGYIQQLGIGGRITS